MPINELKPIGCIQPSIFNISPNPTDGVFAINLDVNEKYDLRVYNTLGQMILSQSIVDMHATVDLSSFENGIYTVELKNDKGIYSEKIIIE